MEEQYALGVNATTDTAHNAAICGHDGRETVVAESVWMLVAAVVGMMLALGGGGAGIVRRLRRARAQARAGSETDAKRCALPRPSPPLLLPALLGVWREGGKEGGSGSKKRINRHRFDRSEM